MTTDGRLCALLRALDTETLTPVQVAEHCLAAVPAATIEDIIAAMRAVAAEQLEEARQLERYHRTRRAGIGGAIDGGRP